VAPEERDAVYNLGIPGIGFVNERRRVYPMGRLAAHTVGYVDLDSKGIAGIEKYLDDQGALYTASLAEGSGETASPAQISADTRVQHALTDELAKAVSKFQAKAAGGIVLDITTGEIIALVSLPDFNPNQEDKKFRKEQANMMTSGVFELGSVIKAVTFAMAFDYGVTNLKGKYDEVFDRESAYELLSAKFASQGIPQTSVVAEIPLKDQPEMTEVAQPTSATMTFRVYDPTTGEYVERQMQAPVQPSVPMQTQYVTPPSQTLPQYQAPQQNVPSAPQGQPPVLVFNPKTGQYEPQQLSAKEQKQAAAKEPKREPSALEKMLANFTRSTASGAGYTVGRSITRNILGVFGIK